MFDNSSFLSGIPLDWVALAIGAGIAGATLFLGLRVFAPRRPESEPEQPVPLPPQLVTELQPPTAGDDKRQAERRLGGNVALKVADAEGKPKKYQGWVVDRSEGGLAISVQESLAAGTILRVRPVMTGELVPWIPVEVRNCRVRGGCWEVGCRFVEPPNANVLVFFG